MRRYCVCVRVIPSMNVRIKREIRVKRISGGERERERIGKEYESLYEKKKKEEEEKEEEDKKTMMIMVKKKTL